MDDKRPDLKLVFFNSEMFLGKCHSMGEEIDVLFRVSIFKEKFHFLIYDHRHLYYSVQEFENITKYHKKENPSIEFTDIRTLIDFLVEKIFKSEDEGRKILQEMNSFLFENFVNIIKVKWRFECDIIQLEDKSDFNMCQALFTKPLLNTLLSVQSFLAEKTQFNIKNAKQNTQEFSNLFIGDLLPIIGTNPISGNKNFNKNMCSVLKESTININVGYLNILEEEKKEFEMLKKKSEIKNDARSEQSSLPSLSNENSQSELFNTNTKKKSKQNKKLKFI